jgi:CRP/FNR family transcriptional regulator, cyclic AMP receptor protein
MADPTGSNASNSDEAGSLAGLMLLEDQTPETIADLEAVCRWETYGEGDLIFDRTDTASDVYFIVKGSVRVVGHAKSGQEVAFIDLVAGQHFGELSALDSMERSATLYTLEDSMLAVLSGDVFVDFMRNHTGIALRLMDYFASMIRTLNSRVVGLSTTTVIQRVYGEILQMAEPDPSNPRHWIINTMPHHKEIAVWAGTTPETVAKAIGSLLEAQVAKRQYKTLHILDRQRLQEMVTAS